eukprot:GHRR01036515.1.p1 GENE.GHRR01036515.1~~GHRR01036515.1.p1  ORF type:complete len:209 (-),score=30.39 GHRR01036515.1:930-1517(-)
MEDAAVAHTSLQDVHLPHVTQDELPQITGLFGVGNYICHTQQLPELSSTCCFWSCAQPVVNWCKCPMPVTAVLSLQFCCYPLARFIHDAMPLLQVFDGHCGSHAATFASERILKRVTGSNFFPSDIKASLVGNPNTWCCIAPLLSKQHQIGSLVGEQLSSVWPTGCGEGHWGLPLARPEKAGFNRWVDWAFSQCN